MSVNDALKGRPLYTLSSDIFPAKEKSGRTAGSSVTGAPVLAVQKNAAGPLAADGQFSPLQVDANGDLRVNVSSIGGSSNVNIVSPLGTGTDATAVRITDGGNSITVDGIVGVNNYPAPLTVVNTGPPAAAQRVALADDSQVKLPEVTVTVGDNSTLLPSVQGVAALAIDNNDDFAALRTDAGGNLLVSASISGVGVTSVPAPLNQTGAATALGSALSTTLVAGSELATVGTITDLSLTEGATPAGTDRGVKIFAHEPVGGTYETLKVDAGGDLQVFSTNAKDVGIPSDALRVALATGSSVAVSGGSLTVDGTVDLGPNLTKTRDDAAGGADKGVQIFAVRNDVAGSLVGTDGDYAPLQVNDEGHLRTTIANFPVTQPVSGTVSVSGINAALSLQHDSIRGPTDYGIQALAVRQDTPGALVSNDGDYTALQTDNNGNLRTTVTNFPATQPVSGTVSVSGINSALSLQRDSIQSPGDYGIQALAVRQDTAGVLVSNDGDYTPLQTDADGYLRTVTMDGNISTVSAVTSITNTVTVDGTIGASNFPSTVQVGAGNVDSSTLRIAVADDSTIAVENLPSAVATDIGSANASTIRVALSSDVAKLTDDPRVGPDYGIQALAVRQDVGGALVGSDGDYTPLQTDADGNLRCSVVGAISSITGITNTVIVDGSGVVQPISDNGGSLTVDGTVLVSNFPSSVQLGVGNADGSTLRVAVADDSTISVENLPITVQTGAGNIDSSTIRVAIANDSTVSAENFPTSVSTNIGLADASTLRVAVSSDLARQAANDVYAADDRGLQALAVRKDAATALAPTDGQFTPLQTDSTGNLRTTVANFPTTVATNSGAADSNTLRTVISSDLSKASAATWSSGNQGIQALAVRNPNRDNLLVSTNQQYTPLSTDRFGNLRTNAGLSVDVAGRLEAAELFTLGDYRCVYNPLSSHMSSHTSGAGNGIAHDTATNSLSLTLAGTNSGHAITQTYQTHPYFAGKAQQCEFTMFNFHAQTGVKKRIGYFYHNNLTAPAPATDTLDGIYLECDGTTGIDFVCKRNGTDTFRVNQSAWNGDKLDGSGNSGVTLDWQKFNVFSIEFLYLGGAIARLNVFVNGQSIIAHEVANFTNNNANVIMGSPNQPFTASIHSTGANAGDFNFVCCVVNSKASAPNIFAGRPLMAQLMSSTYVPIYCSIGAVGTRKPIVGVKLNNSVALNRNITVFISSLNVGFGTDGNRSVIELIRNPTLTTPDLTRSVISLSTGIDIIQYGDTNNFSLDNNTNFASVSNPDQILFAVSKSENVAPTFNVKDLLSITRLGTPVDLSANWDEFWLCVTNFNGSTGDDIYGGIGLTEIK